jgi:RHS repeat-associated protein
VTAAKTETAQYVPADGLLAWISHRDPRALAAENSRLGVLPAKLSLHPGLALANSNTATAFPAGLRRIGTGSRCSGKERDAETGLDYFPARYYSGAQGRFTSPDPGNFGSALIDPQSWNAYAYGRNNPLKYTDPTGLAYTVCQTDENGKQYNCGTVDDKNDKAFLQSLSDSGLSLTAGGRILNGSGDQIGTASYFSQAQQNADIQAAQFLTNQVGPLVNGLGYATGGVLLGAGAGAAYGAIAGGSTALSIPVTSGGTATAATYQLLKDSYKNLELAGEALSGVGQRVIAAGDEIRDVARLVSQYGGKASDWVKLSTSGVDPSKMQAYAQQAGRGTPIQMHYYKNIVTGAIVEMKSVFTGITGK